MSAKVTKAELKIIRSSTVNDGVRVFYLSDNSVVLWNQNTGEVKTLMTQHNLLPVQRVA